MSYDEVGHIKSAINYEKGARQAFEYRYNSNGQLVRILKNGIDAEAKSYDAAGNVVEETLYNNKGRNSQRNLMIYEGGKLRRQRTLNELDQEMSVSTYEYNDALRNLTDLTTKTSSTTQKHHYGYALWEGYQQSTDEASLSIINHATTYGKSERLYDVNGQIKESIDSQFDANGNNSVQYFSSSIDGVRARKDKTGQTSYLTVAGKTIGDLHTDNKGVEELTVYGGFTPTGEVIAQLA